MKKSLLFLTASAITAITWSNPLLAAAAEPAGSQPATADPAGAQPASTQPSAAAAPAPAAPASDPSGMADIIVTARRIQERLQDVPISITVFDNRQLANRNIDRPSDLATYTPSLSTTSSLGGDYTSYAIRGFSQAARTAASVAVYFADVVAPRSGPSINGGDGAGPGQFMDLQNVQVLKGPQGTLFGRNTTGGAVLLVPSKPTNKLEGYVEGQYGSYDWKVVRGVVNVPLSDVARFRVAGEFQDRDGLTKNYGIGPSRFDDRHFFSLRASLVLDLTPDLENYTILSYSKSRNNGTLNRILSCDPTVFPLGTLACGSANAQFARQQGRTVFSGENDLLDPYIRREQWGIINTTTWHASDTLTIKNIASYTQLVSDIKADVSGTNFTIPTGQITFPGLGAVSTGALAGLPITFIQVPSSNYHTAADQYTASEELQFQGQTGNGRLIWQAGLYGEKSGPLGLVVEPSSTLLNCTNAAQLQCSDPLRNIVVNALNLPPAFQSLIPSIGSDEVQSANIRFVNLGIYAQATYSLTDKLKLTGGIRYSDDKTRSSGSDTIYSFQQTNVPVAACARLDLSLSNGCLVSFKQKSAKPTWLVDLDYKPDDDILLYAKYARGYRQGSISVTSSDGYQTFGPESVDSYETGAKLSLRGALRGYINVSAFYNNLKNQQLQATFIPALGQGRPEAGIVNAGKSRVYGVEVESVLVPFRGMTLSGSYAYLNTKLQQISPIDCDPAKYIQCASTSLQGQDLIQSPRHKFSIGATYQLPLDGSVGKVSAGAVFTYQSSQLFPVQAGADQKQPGYGLLNLNLNWDNALGLPVDLSVFATNALNKKYRDFIFGLFTSTGVELAHYGEQRIVGAKLRYRFGG